MYFAEIEDGDAGGLAAGARRGGNRDQRLERARHRQPLADDGVDVIEEISRWIGGVQVDGFGGVQGRASAHGDDRVARRLAREGNGVLERLVVRLHAHTIVENEGDMVFVQRFQHRLDRPRLAQPRIGHDQRPPGSEIR